jgi:hypothetical protein
MNDETLTFSREKLTITATLGETQGTICFRGESDARDPTAFLTEVTDALVPNLAGKTVRIDFRPLRYMNSATVAAILILVRALDAQQVPTSLDYDANVGWQRVNFQCMKAIAKQLRYIVEVVGS